MFGNSENKLQASPQAGGKVLIGQRLVTAGLVTQAQLDTTLRQQKQLASMGRNVRLGEMLVRNRFTTQTDIDRVLAADAGTGVAAKSEFLLAPSICSRYKVIPVSASAGELVVKSARPLGQAEKEALVAASAVKVSAVRVLCADRHEMHAFLSRQMAHESFAAMLDRLRTGNQNASLVRVAIEALLHEAIDMRVSDIHMDVKPEPDAWISLRVDGEMRQTYLLTERMMAALCSRIKTLAGMDASNAREAQDGRLEMDHRGRMVGFRAATQPLVDGETLTIRVIDAASLPTAEALFPFQPRMLELMTNVSSTHGKSGGLMLVTGPTGSGKSTTLYTIASKFPRDTSNIITVENPVEYKLPFARQIQLQDMLAQKATDVERSILRQDPDVLIFGEIRDAESARAALKFAESGHFVLSTLHAQSAGGSTERLMSMIPEQDRAEASFVLASTLKAVVNQRLFRQLCECATPLTDEEHAQLSREHRDLERSMGAPLARTIRRAAGCHRCNGSGYLGRVAVHETLVFAGNEKHRDTLARTLASRSPVKGLMASGAVRMITRSEVVATLVANGLMDALTAMVALGVADEVAEAELELVEAPR